MITVSFYMEKDGTIYAVDEHHIKLFDVLGKLGLKSIPNKTMTYMSTSVAYPGTYTISHNGKESYITVKEPQLERMNVKLPAPIKIDRKSKVSPDQRRQWRNNSRAHGRNTGRNV